ncbi:MAG: AAA family ATPase [Atopobiaceae bacterium]|nr:AAA family ATPase [Atopobiaceae bacterium]
MSSINEEYTKMSLHNHFGGPEADCKIDHKVGRVPRFDLSQGYRSIDSAAANGFELLVQSNANCLHPAEYLLMRQYASLRHIELLPGAEVNLHNWECREKILHVVLVFAPTVDVLEVESKLVQSYAANGNYYLELEQLVDLLLLDRSVVCIHGLKQKGQGRSLSENGELARELLALNRFLPVAVEDNKAYHKATLIEAIKDFVRESDVEWMATDMAYVSTADRTPFSAIASPTYLWAGHTFDDLYYSVLAGSSRVVREEDIVGRPSYISRIEIRGRGGILESSIECSQGLNAIIGTSGSGKTLLLDAIKRKLTGSGLKEHISSHANYGEICPTEQVSLFDPQGGVIELAEGFEVIEGENLYQKVIQAYSGGQQELIRELGLSIDTTALTEAASDFERRANAYLRALKDASEAKEDARLSLAQAISAAKFIEANDAEAADTIEYTRDSSLSSKMQKAREAINLCDADTGVARRSFDELATVAKRHSFPGEALARLTSVREEFEALLTSEKEMLTRELANLRLKHASQDLIFQATQDYNGLISGRFKQANDKRQVISDKLDSLADSLLAIARAELDSIAPALDEETIRDSVRLAGGQSLSKLEIRSVSLRIDDRDCLAEFFPANIGRKPKVKPSQFHPPYDLGDRASVQALLDVFANNEVYEGVKFAMPTNRVMEYGILLKADEGPMQPVEEFSAGMLSKVYVSHFLDAAISNAGSNTIVLYDQPESNMEKEFLLHVLAGKLSELRKTHQIFVATHEPLLVVNADANEIILAKNEKKVDQPNRIGYANRSFVGTHGKSELVDEIARLIDGDTSAVKKRSEIYEGLGDRHD